MVEKIGIFNDISSAQREKMYECFSPTEKTFSAGETIMSFDMSKNRIGVVLGGKARVYCLDYDGEQCILEDIENNGIFGDVFFISSCGFEYYAEAQNECRVMFVDYQCIIKRCEKACEHHSVLANNFIQMMAQRSRNQEMHINVLTRRSVRKKLITYFDFLCHIQNTENSCVVPIHYNALADYINVERSSLMRELRILTDEGVIERNGRQIIFIKKILP